MPTIRRSLLVLYLAMLGLSALGAYMAASFDAPYGPLVELEAVLHSVLGGLYLAPLFLYAAMGRRGLRLGIIVALLAVLGTAALYPLYRELYMEYASPVNPLRYIALAPVMFVLTLAMGLALLPYLPLMLHR